MNSIPAAQSFAWSEPREVTTRNGKRFLRACPLDADCAGWVAWRHDKEAVKALRFGVGKAYGQSSGWEMTHWGETLEQFAGDFEGLLGLLDLAAASDEKAKEAQRIDFVAEDFEPLRSAAAGKLFEWQRPSCQRLVAALKRGNALDASQTGCHARGQLILMFDGTRRRVEDVVVGDLVMGWNSTPRRVLELKRGRQEMARIVPVKGEPFVVNMDHVLTLCFDQLPEEIAVDVTVRAYLGLGRARLGMRGFRLSGSGYESFAFSVELLPEDEFFGFTLDGDGRFLLGDFTVTHNSGKTFVALAACAELGMTPFVIAPLAVLESWRRAARFMGVSLGDVTNWDKARAGSSPFIVKREVQFRGQRAFGFAPRPGNGTLFESAAPSDEFRPLLVLDECQRAKSATSLQGRLLQDCALQGAKLLCLSATAAKDPTEMCGLGLALGLHEGGKSFGEWASRNGCRRGKGGLQFTSNARAAADIMQRIHRVIFPAKGTRVRSADVPGYPENNVTASLVTCGEIVSAYERMRDSLGEIEAKVAAREIDRREAKAQGLAAITKARRASERGKLDFMIEQVRELVADGFQVPVFLNFREHLRIVQRELRLDVEPIWGTAWMGFAPDGSEIDGPAQKPEDRTRIIDGFQEGRQKVVLVSLQAGGAGISLHDVNGHAPRHSLISPSYSAIDLVQAIGRVWRAGSHTKATQTVVYAAGTIEEEIAASVTAKISQIEQLNDGDLLPDCLAHFVGLEGEVKL